MNLLEDSKSNKKSSGELPHKTRENSKIINPRFPRKSLPIKQHPKNPELNEESSPALKQKFFRLFIEELELDLGYQLPKDNIQSLSNFLKDKISFHINCSVSQLFAFWKKLEKVLEKLDLTDCRVWEIPLSDLDFKFDLSEIDMFLNKQSISKDFEETSFLPKSTKSKKIEIPDSQIPICEDIENALQKAFFSNTESIFSEKNFSTTRDSIFLVEKEVEERKKKNLEFDNLKKELQWHKEELKFIISQKKHKKNEYLKKESLLQDQISKIRDQRLLLAENFEKLEKEAKKVEEKKEKIRSILPEISKILTSLNHMPHRESQPNPSIQLNDFESQLKDLEGRFKKCAENEKEVLNIQINRMKTKISGLKSMSAITSASQYASNARSLIKNLNKVYSVNDFIGKKQDITKTESLGSNLQLQNKKKIDSDERISSLNTDRTSSDLLCRRKSEDFSKSEYLKKKEIRLIEKEELLDLTENKIINKLGLGDQINDIKILKVENKRIRSRLERQQKSVEFEYAELEKNRDDVVEKRKEVEIKVEEIRSERKLLADEKLRIAGILRRINEYLSAVLSDL